MHHERADGEDVIHVSTTEARSASRSRLNRNVLLVSLPLVVLFLAAIVVFGFLDTSQSGADDVNGVNRAQSAPAS
ncbi:hypothetical protein [Sphingomonas colocasiae]|uniref:Uncharacterized protein n=1 Tax=Sphingomonas colocasiae TaxID=1848973 RepID=A0ABS7PQD5_9SPHN|nr:hypothetical protein [Sphingomonas colocasiae]MBY8823461.1 hypothetical protein [Sphingomonas colocasiae]